MDCYRPVGDNTLADMHAREMTRKPTNLDGPYQSPMWNAEARLALAVVAAHNGDLDQALLYSMTETPWRSTGIQPSLLMSGSKLDQVLRERYPNESQTSEFRGALLLATMWAT